MTQFNRFHCATCGNRSNLAYSSSDTANVCEIEGWMIKGNNLLCKECKPKKARITPLPAVSAEPIVLSLPVPPSINHSHDHSYGRRYKNKKALAWIEQASIAAGRITPVSGEISVTLKWFRAAKRGDLDNRCKLTLDFLQGRAFFNDSQVVEIHMFRYEDPTAPRIEVTVTQLAPAAVKAKRKDKAA